MSLEQGEWYSSSRALLAQDSDTEKCDCDQCYFYSSAGVSRVDVTSFFTSFQTVCYCVKVLLIIYKDEEKQRTSCARRVQ